MRYWILAITLLMATVSHADDVTIKDLPSEVAKKVRAYADVEIARYENQQLALAVEELVTGDYTKAEQITQNYKVVTDTYRVSNNKPQVWNAANWTDVKPLEPEPVEPVAPVINWTDVKPLEKDDNVNWVDIERIA